VEVVKTLPEEALENTAEKKIQNIDGMKIETRFGEILFQFHPEAAPKTVAQVKKAVKEGYFNGIYLLTWSLRQYLLTRYVAISIDMLRISSCKEVVGLSLITNVCFRQRYGSSLFIS
jgi:hypothetical protein